MNYSTSLSLSQISHRHKDFLITILEDLAKIRLDWDSEATDTLLRQEAILLRQLLVQDGGTLFQVARLFNTNLKVHGPARVQQILSKKGGIVKFYQAGGAVYQGMGVRSIFERDGVSPDPAARYRRHQRKKELNSGRTYCLVEYLNSICFVLDGQPITRENLIKYVCNKIGGGGHFDLGKLGGVPKKLDEIRQRYRIADKNAIYFELLAIGQALTSSPSVMELEKNIRRVLK